MILRYSCIVPKSEENPVKYAKGWLKTALANTNMTRKQPLKNFNVEVCNDKNEVIPTSVLFTYKDESGKASK